jgi:uncharacterized protein (TIGR02265 family)
MGEPERARAVVVPDLDPARAPVEVSFHERLAATPPSAEIRGVFFSMVQRAIEEEEPPHRRVSGTMRRDYAMYPVRGYLRFVYSAAIARSEAPERAIERWSAHAMRHLLASGIAHVFLRRADHAPFALLHRLERSRALFASYGEWHVSGHDGDVTITLRDEWIWIREAWVPAIASIFEALDRAPPRIDCTLTGPFDARVRVRW